jgi:hypothetical protein
VVDGVLRWVAIIVSLLVVAGFAMFAADQLTHASHQQVSALNDSPAPQQGTTPASSRSGFRRAIDDVDNVLLKPFSGAANSTDSWVRHGVPTLLAILVYGLGLGFLARYVRVRG